VRESTGSDLDVDGKWFIAKRHNHYNSGRVGIIYGQVPYPANTDAIVRGVTSICTDEQIEFYKTFSDMVVFIFDVGALSITANREELKYDDDTLASIANRITEFHSKFFTRTKNLIEGFENNDSLYKINRFLMEDVFNGEKEFFKSLDFAQIDCDAFVMMKIYKSKWGKTYSRSIYDVVGVNSLYTVGHLDSYFSEVANETKARIRQGCHVDILGIDKPIVYYVMDDPKNAAVKVRQDFLANNVKGTAYVFLKPRDIKGTDPQALADDLAVVKESLGNPDFIFTSTLAYTAPIRQKGLGKKKKQIGTVFSNAPHWINKSDLDFEAGGVYVYLAGGTKLYKGSKALYENGIFNNYVESPYVYQRMVDIYNKVHGTSITTHDIIGVSAVDIKNFDGDTGWTNLLDTVEKYVQKNQKQMYLKLQEVLTVEHSLRDVGNDCTTESFFRYFDHLVDSLAHVDRKNVIDQLDNNGEFHKTLVKLRDIKKKLENDRIVTKGHDVLLGIFADYDFRRPSQNDNQFQVKIDSELITLEKKYGMIGMLDRFRLPYGNLEELQTIIDYVIMIDNK